VTFLDALRASQLVEAGQIDDVANAIKLASDDPAPLAREFVRRNLLTPFQMRRLLRGAGNELVLGPYRLLERIGEGGMGQVYKAHHQPLDRILALKVIRKDKLSDPEAVGRFHQEIRAAAQLIHPNIVMAYDAGQSDGTHYFAMEYVDGTNLSQLVRASGPLSVAQACDYLRQAALGLQHAHERGLVHRDIKPSNLLVSGIGNQKSGVREKTRHGGSPLPPDSCGLPPVVKILDLGLARLQNSGEESNQLTRLGVAIGTPEYLAPEQVRNSRTVDIRADLYSLGCTLYYLLTGQPPFRGETPMAVMRKHLHEAPPPLTSRRPDVPPAVAALVSKLMAKNPEDRYQTAAELAAALAPLAGLSMVASAPPPPAIPAALPAAEVCMPFATIDHDETLMVCRPKPKRQWLAAAVAIICLAVTAAGAAILWQAAADQSAKPALVADAKSSAKFLATKPKSDGRPDPKPASEPSDEPAIKQGSHSDPAPRPMPEPEPKSKPEPKPEPERQKLPVPDDAQQAASAKTLYSKYKVEYGRKKADDVAVLANQLLTDAAEAKEAAVRFVLLREARDLAAVAGNVETMMKAIDELDKQYTVDVLEMKIAALERASQAPNLPPAKRAIVEVALKMIEEMVDADDYEAGDRLLAIAKTAVLKANSLSHKAKVDTASKDLADIRKEFSAARAARDQLAEADDADASSRWGKFVAFFKGHWGDGLPLLADGSDLSLVSLAQKDLAGAKDPTKLLEIGDGWYALGKVENAQVARKNLWSRARFWYDQALPGLGATAKIEVEKRLKEIDTILPKDEAPANKPAVASPSDHPAKTEAQNLIQDARAKYRAGRYAEAIDIYKSAL